MDDGYFWNGHVYQYKRPYLSMFQVAVIFSAINWPCVAIWAMFGSKLRERLKQPKILKRFNLVMGILLALSGISVLFQ